VDPHGGRVDREAGGGPRRLTSAARAALAALVDAARRLGTTSQARLRDHVEEEIEHEQGTEGDRHGPARRDPR
jgi:hypothetical protein